MLPLSNSLEKFTQAVSDGKSIVFDQKGNWSERHAFFAFFRRLFGLEKQDSLNCAKNYGRYLHTFSISSAKLREGFVANIASNEDIKNATQAIYDRLKPYLHKNVQKRLALHQQKKALEIQIKTAPTSQTVQIQAQIKAIKRDLFTLEQLDPIKKVNTYIQRADMASLYAGKSQDEIYNPAYNKSDLDWVTNKVVKWKKPQRSLPNKPLSEWEKISIEKILYYPELVRAIKSDHVLRASLFNFVFKNLSETADDAVDIFVQAPKIQRRLTKSFLDIRVRKMANHGLRLIEGDDKKDVQLLIENKFVSLKDLNESVSSGGKTDTLRSLFRKFKNLNDVMPEWEYMQDGIVYTNTPSPIVDLSKDTWYDDLRDFKTYTKDEVTTRIREHSQEPIDWKKTKSFLFVKAARTQQNKHPAGNHGWLEILVPQSDGTFKGQSFGTFSDFFPVGETYFGPLPRIFPSLKKFFHATSEFIFTFGTHRGIVASPDQNEYNYAREKVELPLPLTEEQYIYAMQQLKEDMIRARKGNMVFQGQGSNNCAGWVQTLLDRLYAKFSPIKAPRVYEVHDAELTLPKSMRILVQDPKRGFFSNLVAKIASSAVSLLLGGGKIVLIDNKEGKKELVCLLTNEMRVKKLLHLPAKLFETKEKIRMLDLSATVEPDLRPRALRTI